MATIRQPVRVRFCPCAPGLQLGAKRLFGVSLPFGFEVFQADGGQLLYTAVSYKEVIGPGAQLAALRERYGDGAVDGALRRWALRATERVIEEGAQSGQRKVVFEINEHDVPVLEALAADKSCPYQVSEAEDLFCSAAWAGVDKTIVGTLRLKALAPTTRHLCQGCGLPDTDEVCSHLRHPRVTCQGAEGASARRLVGASCELGRSEVGVGSSCHPGGNDCWERLVDLKPRKPTAAYSPEQLLAALEFLDTV